MNEELTSKLEELLQKAREIKGGEESNIPREKKREDIKEFAKGVESDSKNEDTLCALYASNSTIGLCGTGFEMKALLGSIMSSFLERDIISPEELLEIVKKNIEIAGARAEGKFDEYFEKELDKFFKSLEELFKD